MEIDTWPEAGIPILNDLGYFMHDGGHGTKPEDYDVYLDFIKVNFKIIGTNY